MKHLKLLAIIALCVSVQTLSAQTVDSTFVVPKIDARLVAQIDSLRSKGGDAQPKSDSVQPKRHVPVPIPSTRAIGQVAAIDTLPTASDELQIILFNDNTWRYVRTKPAKKDEKIFSEYWNTSVTHSYYGISAEKLPETTAIQLVDSLSGHHYPYKGWMSSKFGPRGGRGHHGVDLPLKIGDPVYATFDGKVRYSAFSSSGYGNLVIIRHTNGLETYYAHLSERCVESGDWVVAGQQIGKGGSTGRSSGPHLHFETRYKGLSFDPERIFDFKTGDIRRKDLLLKRRHFSIYSKYEQDFDDEGNEKKVADTKTTTAAKTPSTSKTSSTKSSTTKTSTAKTTTSKSTSSDQYHTVVEGDTFGSLAIKYNTTSKKIQELNPDVDPTKMQIGKKIRVSGKVSSSSTSSSSKSNAVYHTIVEGDTFGHLAIKYNTTSKKIQELNPNVDPAKIQIGQKIRIK